MVKTCLRDDTPPAPGPSFEVVRLRANQQLYFTAVADVIRGFWTHWSAGSTVQCFGSEQGCALCESQTPRRWKGYLHIVWADRKPREGFLELTPVAVECIKAQTMQGMSLRGWRFRIQRGNGNRAHLKVELHEPLPDLSGLPVQRDPLATLQKLWTWKQDHQSK